jgi:hypothetical protein
VSDAQEFTAQYTYFDWMSFAHGALKAQARRWSVVGFTGMTKSKLAAELAAEGRRRRGRGDSVPAVAGR